MIQGRWPFDLTKKKEETTRVENHSMKLCSILVIIVCGKILRVGNLFGCWNTSVSHPLHETGVPSTSIWPNSGAQNRQGHIKRRGPGGFWTFFRSHKLRWSDTIFTFENVNITNKMRKWKLQCLYVRYLLISAHISIFKQTHWRKHTILRISNYK